MSHLFRPLLHRKLFFDRFCSVHVYRSYTLNHKTRASSKERQSQVDYYYDALLLEKTTEGMEEIINMMKSTRVQPDTKAYTILITAHCNSNAIDKAIAAKKIMEAEHISPNAYTYGPLIKAYMEQNDEQAAEALLTEMKQRKVLRNEVIYTILINGYSRNKNREKMYEKLKEMQEDNIKPNVHTCTSIIKGLVNMHMLDEAYEQLESFESVYHYKATPMYNALLAGYGYTNEFEKAKYLANQMKTRNINLNMRSYITLLFIAVQSKEGELTENQIFSEMKSNNVVLTEELFSDFIVKISQAGHFEKTFGLLDRMKRQYITPKEKLFDELVTYATLAKQPEVAERYLYLMRQYGFNPKVKNYMVTASVYADLKNVTAARKLITFMKNSGVHTHEEVESVQRTVLRNLANKADLEDAHSFFEEHIKQENGNMIDVSTYSILIHAYARKQKISKAEDVFQDMIHHGVKPNIVTYTTLIKGYVLCDKIDSALQIKEQMEANNIVPNDVTVTTLASYWMRNNDLPRAMELYHEYIVNFKDQGYHEKVFEYFLKHCVRKKNVKYSWKVFKKMVEHNFSPDKQTQVQLLAMLINCQLVKKAMKLLSYSAGIIHHRDVFVHVAPENVSILSVLFPK